MNDVQLKLHDKVLELINTQLTSGSTIQYLGAVLQVHALRLQLMAGNIFEQVKQQNSIQIANGIPNVPMNGKPRLVQ